MCDLGWRWTLVIWCVLMATGCFAVAFVPVYLRTRRQRMDAPEVRARRNGVEAVT